MRIADHAVFDGIGLQTWLVQTNSTVPKVVSISCSVFLAHAFVNAFLLRDPQEQAVPEPRDQELFQVELVDDRVERWGYA